jgi:hypothetical protein
LNEKMLCYYSPVGVKCSQKRFYERESETREPLGVV